MKNQTYIGEQKVVEFFIGFQKMRIKGDFLNLTETFYFVYCRIELDLFCCLQCCETVLGSLSFVASYISSPYILTILYCLSYSN